MEFHEKLQKLRKQRGLSQEELAAALYVSRTAISKWESGRGYPNIDSLKRIAATFSVTVDDLLSGDEFLAVAENDRQQHARRLCDPLLGLLDISTLLYWFLPLFTQKGESTVQAVSLSSLTAVSPYVKVLFLITAVFLTMWGILVLVLQNCDRPLWTILKTRVSLIISGASTFLFIIGSQPYAASVSLVFLVIKAWLVFKQR